jgi:hemerythrin
MARLEWNEFYSIGNDDIDNEHRQIFILANELQAHQNDDVKLKQAVKAVIDYTKYHFKSEENYMQSINYEGLEEHKQIHKEIILALSDFLKNINTLSNEEITQTLYDFLTTRIISHILIEDKKVQYCNKDLHQLRQLFRWKNSYGIGDATLDSDHKKLFSIAVKVLNYSQNGHAKLSIKETIKELYLYMQEHFDNEERYMQKIGYKDFDAHKKLHDNIMLQMNSFVKSLATLKKENFERQLIEYMDIWLVNHIVIEDRKIAQFAIQRRYIV